MKTFNTVFDGFCHRPYKEDLDGWMESQLEEIEVPSLQMANDIIALYAEVNRLRRENWYLNKGLNYES
jgi:hypothetical protein